MQTVFAQSCKHRVNLHTADKLRVGEAGIPATYSNKETNPLYQNTFKVVHTTESALRVLRSTLCTWLKQMTQNH